jgi:3-methyladenine DNA glycosylase/8-oxoguanine DNA glycosylase
MGPLAKGRHDPSLRVDRDTALLASRTPDGLATLWLHVDGTDLHAEAWGPGAAWLLERAPALAGVDDRPEELRTDHPVVADLVHRCAGLRLGKGANPVEVAVRTIIEQRVTSAEAAWSWHRLVARFGEPAPGPLAATVRLRVPPDPEILARLPVWEYRRLGLEQKRAVGVRAVAVEAPRILRDLDDRERVVRRLAALPSIGPWTLATVRLDAYGDPDAALVGDWHVPRNVCFALTGEVYGDDARMLELLAQFPGQGGRVCRLVGAAGPAHPRRAPGIRRNTLLTG